MLYYKHTKYDKIRAYLSYCRYADINMLHQQNIIYVSSFETECLFEIIILFQYLCV